MASFEDIYEEHVRPVYGFLVYRLADRAEAQDLTQTTFERALRAWPSFDPSRAAPRTWLIAIARNLLIDHSRSARARAPAAGLDQVPERELPAAPGPEADVGLSPAVASALARLGERERELLALRFGSDLSGRQIAELTGLSLANVQQILSRTLRRLRVELSEG